MNYEIDCNDKTPVYKQIVKNLNEAIVNGEFSEEKKLPTERELSAKFNVARGTIKSAFNELEKQGKRRKIQKE
jgi:DNA-binding GntR family transcriptional regulator